MVPQSLAEVPGLSAAWFDLTSFWPGGGGKYANNYDSAHLQA